MTNVTIKNEMQRRENLVNSKEFRIECAKVAKKMGITQQEWEKNKAIICMFFANEYCRIENQN